MGAGFADEGKHLILVTVPTDIVDAHRGVTRIEDLILVVFVASIEDEWATMLPSESVIIDKGRRNITTAIVVSVVLTYHHSDLFLRIRDHQIAIVQRDVELLMTRIEVDVCIRRRLHEERHLLFCYHKLHTGQLLLLFVVDDIQAVVTTHLQTTLVVGNLQLVVGIGDDGVDGWLMIFDHDGIEAFEPVALKNTLSWCPVCFTAFEGVGIAMVVVREFIEGDVQDIIRPQPEDSRRHEILIDDSLQ